MRDVIEFLSLNEYVETKGARVLIIILAGRQPHRGGQRADFRRDQITGFRTGAGRRRHPHVLVFMVLRIVEREARAGDGDRSGRIHAIALDHHRQLISGGVEGSLADVERVCDSE